MTITIELDEKSAKILNRLKGDMTPSDFFRILLQMVDSQSVGAPIAKKDGPKANGGPSRKA